MMHPQAALGNVVVNVGGEELFAFGVAHHRLEFAQQLQV